MNDGLKDRHRRAILDILGAHPGVDRAVLFGSRAMGTFTPASDVDICLYGDSLTLTDQARLAARMEELTIPQRVDLLLHHAIEDQALLDHIAREGKVLFERDGGEAGEWRETTLGEAADFLSGGTPSKARPDYWAGSVPWVSAKDMKRFRLDDTEDHVSDDGVASGTKLAPAGSVLLLARGMTLLNDLPICVINRPMTFNQDVKALRPKPHVRSDYLPYLLLGKKDRLLSLVDLAGHGTGRLNSDELKALDVALPPLDEQRAIAHILGALDDKIELNRRMNETLETMTRALFKSWFVDFDPVRAKAEGRDPGLPKPLADLFPARLVDSELGEIPEGWDVGTLDSVLVLQRGFDLPAMHRTSGSYPVIAASGTHNRFMVRGPGVTTGRSGVLGKVFYVADDFWPLNTSLWVKEFRRATPAYAFHLLGGIDFALFNAGSAVPTLNRNHVHKLPTLLPPIGLIDAFECAATGCLDRQKNNVQQAATLATIRDALLPQLISGQLRVHDAEQFIGRVS